MTGRQKEAIAWAALGLAWVAIFAVMEAYGLMHDDAITLSRFVYQASAAWPPLVFAFGLTVGVLAEHFWRHLTSRWNAIPRDLVKAPWRAIALVAAWAVVVALTDGGPAIFLAGLSIGMLVTHFWWPWNPNDPVDHRG